MGGFGCIIGEGTQQGLDSGGREDGREAEWAEGQAIENKEGVQGADEGERRGYGETDEGKADTRRAGAWRGRSGVVREEKEEVRQEIVGFLAAKLEGGSAFAQGGELPIGVGDRAVSAALARIVRKHQLRERKGEGQLYPVQQSLRRQGIDSLVRRYHEDLQGKLLSAQEE